VKYPFEDKRLSIEIMTAGVFFQVCRCGHNGIQNMLEIMNERFFLKLLLLLFSGLIAAELLLVVMFGLRLELIILCFIIAAALTGIVIVVRLLMPERIDTESVSMRRARAMREESMRERFQDYAVDEEFLGRKGARDVKGNAASTVMESSSGSAQPSAVSIEEAIRVHAGMYGGLAQLLQMMENMDEPSFGRLMAKVGFPGVSMSDVVCRIRLMADGEEEECCVALNSSLDEAIEAFGRDRESFDDYIRRSMTGGNNQSESGEGGFAVELDSAALSQGTGVMPADFSHDPKSVLSKLKKPGAPS